MPRLVHAEQRVPEPQRGRTLNVRFAIRIVVYLIICLLLVLVIVRTIRGL